MENVLFAFIIAAPIIWFGLLLVPRQFANNNRQFLIGISTVASHLAWIAILFAAGVMILDNKSTLTIKIDENAILFLDALSIIMATLIGFIGWVIIRFSKNYLDGNPRQGTFFQWLGATLGSVFIIVLAGNLILLLFAWIASSLALHQLLAFNSDRPAAVISARKKFIFSRIADLCLIAATVLLYREFQTLGLPNLLDLARNQSHLTTSGQLHFSLFLLACGAMLKSAQFPFHTWLPDTLETPTPVSALMHAGIISAGGFLLIRLSPLMVLSPQTLNLIACIGATTALFGSVVMLTQTSIKKSLAYSTVAQMGYMMLQCGLGAFSLAALHLVAHSLYKAHTFLSSGSAINLPNPISLASGRISSASNSPSVGKTTASMFMGIALTLGVGWAFGVSIHEEPGLIVLGSVLAMAVTTLILNAGLSDQKLLFKGMLWGSLTCLAYFTLHSGLAHILSEVAPASKRVNGPLEYTLMALILSGFSTVFFLQLHLYQVQNSKWVERLYVLALNRCYFNTIVNRWMATIWPARSKSPVVSN
jgi:NAD(P)H-quinone oxidoreductase subunit 5